MALSFVGEDLTVASALVEMFFCVVSGFVGEDLCVVDSGLTAGVLSFAPGGFGEAF